MRTRILWRYVTWQWLKIFLLTAVGLPAVQSLIAITDQLNKLFNRGVTSDALPAIFLFGLPEGMFQMMPAASLFATVFTIGPLSRHSELTAAKAGGISFHRLVFPLLVAAAGAGVANFYIGEYATRASARQLELQKERQVRSITTRYNFVFRADQGWTYTIRSLDTQRAVLSGLLLERPSRRAELAGLSVTADSATWSPEIAAWTLWHGATHTFGDSAGPRTVRFASMRLASLSETPRQLLITPKQPEEMTWAELGGYVDTMERAGYDVRELVVKRWLKIAVPVTCLIIAIFGAPLAVSAPRAGAAVGIAISLGTTIIFLMFVQLAIAAGKSGLINPDYAAWVPNAIFLALGMVLMARVKT
ncbi:MAG: LptF/LptG family permease [Gemmatimonadota bacterium]|nr:LptF/LptG family permease [Gemmatimonadota bacterium]